MLLIITCVMAIIAAVTWFNKESCDSKAIEVAEQIKGMGDSLAIQEIVLFKSHPGYEINLVDDTLRISDTEALRKIQRMLFQSKHRRRNHPKPTWLVNLKIELLNKKQLIMAVSKISNDSANGMTYFIFPENKCPGDDSYYSLELGAYLEQLSSFTGERHK